MDKQKYEEYAQKFQKALLAIRKLKKDLAEAKQNPPQNQEAVSLIDTDTSAITEDTLTGHPLLGEYLQLADEPNLHIWNSKLSTQNTPYLAEHRINKDIILPSSVYVEMLLAAVNEIFKEGNHVVRALNFHQKLAVQQEGDFNTIQLKIKTQHTDNQLFIGQKEGFEALRKNILFAFYVKNQEGNWELYADGKVQIHAPFENFRKFSKERFEIGVENAEIKISKQDHYELIKQFGLNYGDSFRGVQEVCCTENVAWVTINIPPEIQNTAHYFLHPAILDSCLQTAVDTLPSDILENLEDFSFCLNSIASLQLIERLTQNTKELFVHVELTKATQNRQGFYFNMTISDGDTILMRLFDICIEKYSKNGNYLDDDNGTVSEKKDIDKDILLDENIALNGLVYDAQADWKNIFLTGATEFSGAFMLKELIENTYATIHCLVTANNQDLALKLIKSNLKKQGLWKSSYSKRIVPITGDLARPRLGFAQDKFDALAKEIDVIFHFEFMINWVYTYSDVRAANVLGTKELFKLATQSKIKALHFRSTIATFSSINFENGMHIEEKDILEDGEKLKIGSTQTRWVVEKLIREAQKRYLPFNIYRFGDISGHSQSGDSDTGAFMPQLIKGCIKMGFVPDKGLYINLLPVDYLISSMFRIASNPSIATNTFHFTNPQVISWTEFIVWIRNYGFSLEIIPFQEWKAKLLELAKENLNDETYRALAPVFVPLRLDSQTEDTSFWDLLTRLNYVSLDTKNTINALKHTTLSCPSLLDDGLLDTYFEKYVESGFLNLSND